MAFSAAEKAMLKTLISAPWVLTSTSDAVHLLHASCRDQANQLDQELLVQQFDFGRMYPSIKQDDLKIVVNRVLRMIFCSYDRRAKPNPLLTFKATNDYKHFTCTWEQVHNVLPADTEKANYFDFDRMQHLFAFVIDNCFTVFDRRLYHQTDGIPMGSELSTALCNMYLFYYEYSFLHRAINAPYIRADILKCFKYTGRYIDDLITVNNGLLLQSPELLDNQQQLEDGFRGMYPAYLNLVPEEPQSRGHFLDAAYQFDLGTRRFRLAVHDKRREERYAAVPSLKYPHIASGLSEASKYGVIGSQFHRFARICSDVEAFASACAQLTYELYVKGYIFAKLKRYALKTLGKLLPLFDCGNANPRWYWSQHIVPVFLQFCKLGLDVLRN